MYVTRLKGLGEILDCIKFWLHVKYSNYYDKKELKNIII